MWRPDGKENLNKKLEKGEKIEAVKKVRRRIANENSNIPLKMHLLYILVSVVGCVTSQDLIVKTIVKPDTCERFAKTGDFLRVHYVGRFDDENGEVFDSSRERGDTYPFQLGAGQVRRSTTTIMKVT